MHPHAFRRAALLCALGLGLALGGAGCAAPAPNLQRDFGLGLRQALALQTLHPDAGRQPAPGAGMDAQAANSAYQQYQKSYQAQEAPGASMVIGASGAKH